MHWHPLLLQRHSLEGEFHISQPPLFVGVHRCAGFNQAGLARCTVLGRAQESRVVLGLPSSTLLDPSMAPLPIKTVDDV